MMTVLYEIFRLALAWGSAASSCTSGIHMSRLGTF